MIDGLLPNKITKASSFKCTECSKFSTTPENYSLLCLDLQSGLRNRRFNNTNPYSWQVLIHHRRFCNSPNVTSGVPQIRPTYLFVVFLALAIHLAHFTFLHFTVRAILRNHNSDTLEVPVRFLKLGATERFQWLASLWYRIPFASIKALPILRWEFVLALRNTW